MSMPFNKTESNSMLWLGHGTATQAAFLVNQSGGFSAPVIVDTSTYVNLNLTFEIKHPHFQNWADFGFSGHIKIILS